jgi:hypothetical protein
LLDLRLVTVSYDAESGAFPEAPLADLSGEIVSVVEHFFFHDGLPRLLLVVQHHPPEDRPARSRGRGAPRDDPRHGLSADEAKVYDRLRTWRRGRAEADGVPVYVIFNNRELAEIARRGPASLTALQEVPGIGQNKAQRYGPDLLRMLAAAPADEAAQSREAGDGQA